MNIVTACIYWVIVAIWLIIIATTVYFYLSDKRIIGTTRLLLLVLLFDGTRDVIENVYFGLYFGSKYGLFSVGISKLLGNPYLLIMPKMTNVAAGCAVLGILLLRWLPQEIRERKKAEVQVRYLHELATTDGMTGLLNRREFIAQTEVEWQRCLRHGRPLSLAIIDIDNFKAINDEYGHNAGDEVIVLITKLCRETKRASDVAGRLGGEEFAILLPETRLAEAHSFVDRLRMLIVTETETIFDTRLPTTISIGLSYAAQAGSMLDFFKQADIALYEAKRSGRNRVCDFEAMGSSLT